MLLHSSQVRVCRSASDKRTCLARVEVSLTGRAGEVMSIRLSSQAVDEQHGGSASSGFDPYGLDNHTSLYLEYRCRAFKCLLLLCEPTVQPHSAMEGTVGSCIQLVSPAVT